MDSLTEMEKDAAPMLELYDYNEEDKSQMRGDMVVFYKKKYLPQQCKKLFDEILANEDKINQIKQYIQARRRTAGSGNLVHIMTDEKVLELDKKDPQDENADGYDNWYGKRDFYYQLFPAYTPDEIDDRWEESISAMTEKEMLEVFSTDKYAYLLKTAGYWAEYHNFDFEHHERDMIDDFFNDHWPREYRSQLTVRRCRRFMRNVRMFPHAAVIEMMDKRANLSAHWNRAKLFQKETLGRCLYHTTKKFSTVTPDELKRRFIRTAYGDVRDTHPAREVIQLVDRRYPEYFKVCVSLLANSDAFNASAPPAKRRKTSN